MESWPTIPELAVVDRRRYPSPVNEAETKTCPLCCEPVRPAARKCPHCQHYLNKWVLAAYHPLIAMSPMLLVFGVGFYLLSRAIDRGQSFEAFRSQVHITHSELQLGELPAGPTVAVVGTIHNDSNVAWKELTIEVQFFDKSHKLIDTKQRQDYSLALPPKDNCAFKISQPREFNLADYASHEVRVITAKDAKGFLQ
jgi:hypothetical protein